jgi:hypothetical protein
MVDSNRFPLQNVIKKILDNPNTRPALPVLKNDSSTGDGSSVGDDNFREPAVYDTGTSPSVALNNENVVVEVHKNAKSDALYYHVGKVADNKISFGGSQKYDSGVQPSVAITDGGLVVEAHKSENFNTLYYHVGRVAGDKITFGGSQKYDDGVQPSVAITNDGLVVEVHKSQSHDTLWYHIGRVDGDKITFGTSQKYDDGVHPSVAITDEGLVVEVHQSKDSENFGKIHYHIGRVAGDKINWEKSFQYDSGSRPSVAITNDGVVVEVHQSEVFETVWYRGIGQVKDNTITWRNEKSQEYSKGREPRVTCNGELAVATHTDGEKLFSSVLKLPTPAPILQQTKTFNLLMGTRPSAPYKNLPRYNKDLTKTGTNPNDYPVEVTRHHIVPFNQLKSLWNKMVEKENLTNSARSLIRSITDLLEQNPPEGGINLDVTDKEQVKKLLEDIRSGGVKHDPNKPTADGWDSLQQVYAWLPGNLFIGPSVRSDDPEEKFESNAGVVVGNSFKTWEDTDSLITKYIENPSTGNAQAAANQLSKIIDIRNEPFPLNKSNWVQDGEDNGTPKYKLK